MATTSNPALVQLSYLFIFTQPRAVLILSIYPKYIQSYLSLTPSVVSLLVTMEMLITLYQSATFCECSVPDHFVFIIYIFMICGLAMLNHENMIGMVNLLVKESEIHIGNWKLPAPQSHDKTPIIACVISNQ